MALIDPQFGSEFLLPVQRSQLFPVVETCRTGHKHPGARCGFSEKPKLQNRVGYLHAETGAVFFCVVCWSMLFVHVGTASEIVWLYAPADSNGECDGELWSSWFHGFASQPCLTAGYGCPMQHRNDTWQHRPPKNHPFTPSFHTFAMFRKEVDLWIWVCLKKGYPVGYLIPWIEINLIRPRKTPRPSSKVSTAIRVTKLLGSEKIHHSFDTKGQQKSKSSPNSPIISETKHHLIYIHLLILLIFIYIYICVYVYLHIYIYYIHMHYPILEWLSQEFPKRILPRIAASRHRLRRARKVQRVGVSTWRRFFYRWCHGVFEREIPSGKLT